MTFFCKGWQKYTLINVVAKRFLFCNHIPTRPNCAESNIQSTKNGCQNH